MTVLIACGGGGGSGAGTSTRTVKQHHLGIHTVHVPKDSVLLVTVTGQGSTRVKVSAFEELASLKALATFFSTDESQFVPSDSSSSEPASALPEADRGDVAQVRGVQVAQVGGECTDEPDGQPVRVGLPAPIGTTVQVVVQTFAPTLTAADGTYTIELRIEAFPADHNVDTYGKALTNAPFGSDFFGSRKFCTVANSIN